MSAFKVNIVSKGGEVYVTNNGDNHGVVLVDGVNAFEISIGECYGGKTSRWLYVDAVDINIFDGVEMTLPGLAR